MSTGKPDHAVGDLLKKSRSELQDLLKRQNRIIANTKLLDTLPDKGTKLKHFKEAIEQALKNVEDQDQLSSLFHKLRIHRRITENNMSDNDDILESEALQNAVPSMPVLTSEVDATKNDSTVENSPNNESSSVQPTSRKGKSTDQSECTKRKHFYPNRNACIPATNPNKPKQTWIETAVTPPPALFTQAKTLSLSESITLLKSDQERHQHLAQEQAMEALRTRIALMSDDSVTPSTTFGSYREQRLELNYSEDEKSDEED